LHAFLRPSITTAMATTDRESSRSRLVPFVLRRTHYALQDWVLFESHSRALEQRIVRWVEEFLHKLWTHGALVGASHDEAYRATLEEDPTDPESSYLLTMQLSLAPDGYVVSLVLPLRRHVF